MNSSNVFRNSSRSRSYGRALITNLNLANEIVESLTMPFGILLNIWVLLAVLTRKDIWSRMRNKVVCSLCSLHLLTSLVYLPMDIDRLRKSRLYGRSSCRQGSLIGHMFMMQDFISNWTLVLLVVCFVSQVCDHKPHHGLSRLATAVGTYTVLALPWVGSVVTIPVTTTSTFDSYLKRRNISNYFGCIFPTLESYLVLWWLDNMVPLLLAAFLLATGVVLRRRRLTRGVSSGMQVELIDRGAEMDDHCGYTAAVVVTLACDLPAVCLIFHVFEQGSSERFISNLINFLLSITKTVFTPLALLFFPDLRERLKTWRPWYNPKPGIDLTLVNKSTTQ